MNDVLLQILNILIYISNLDHFMEYVVIFLWDWEMLNGKFPMSDVSFYYKFQHHLQLLLFFVLEHDNWILVGHPSDNSNF